MANFQFRYRDGVMTFDYPDEDILQVIEPAKTIIPEGDEISKVMEALEHPIGSPKLEEIVKPGETVCILVPDMTRQWGHPAQIVKVLVDKLTAIGIRDEQMLIVSAVGTHKKQSPEEHALLVGQDIYDRIKVVDHDCDSDLVKVGTSFRGNDIWLNKTVMSYDRKIIVGCAVFHFLAGFGGSRKYVLPGIAGRDTIMNNHSQYFAEGGVGSGANPQVAPGLYEDNPISREMFEAAEMAKIDFVITGVVGPDKQIDFCYAGDLHESHARAVDKCREMDGVQVDEAADLVIASGMGFPKDINLYQTMSKPINNAMGALKKSPDAVLIVAAECREGIGNPDTVRLLREMDTAREREIYTREHYTIGLNIAYMLTQIAEDFHFILVSAIDPEIFSKSKIHGVSTIDKALDLAKQLTGNDHMKAYIMPYAANTCVSVRHK